jgi:hypothetical protein
MPDHAETEGGGRLGPSDAALSRTTTHSRSCSAVQPVAPLSPLSFPQRTVVTATTQAHTPLGAGQTGLSIAKRYHARIADVFTAEKTQTSSRSQETRPPAAADHAEDANCPTATINATKPSLQRYQAIAMTASSPVHFDTPPPATPQRTLLEPPPEPPSSMATPAVLASSPSTPSLQSSPSRLLDVLLEPPPPPLRPEQPQRSPALAPPKERTL